MKYSAVLLFGILNYSFIFHLYVAALIRCGYKATKVRNKCLCERNEGLLYVK